MTRAIIGKRDVPSEMNFDPSENLLVTSSGGDERRPGVEEFLEREERRRKLQEEASTPKKLQREEWMLVPPKKNAPPEEDSHDTAKRRRWDEEIRRRVEGHTRKARGSALVESHIERENEEETHKKSEPSVIWHHEHDMSLGGQLMDNKQRQKMLRDAKGSESVSAVGAAEVSSLTLVVKTPTISSGTIATSTSPTRVSEPCAVGFQARVAEAELRHMMPPSFRHLIFLFHCKLCLVIGLCILLFLPVTIYFCTKPKYHREVQVFQPACALNQLGRSGSQGISKSAKWDFVFPPCCSRGLVEGRP
ncbi:hypothetical protein BDR05DRAFT_951648 [Suillus weaverae]|nr:hypothetical protein BDR05DRAFT_951648 [Suillus weaverae]